MNDSDQVKKSRRQSFKKKEQKKTRKQNEQFPNLKKSPANREFSFQISLCE